jgi:hypothetical protein
MYCKFCEKGVQNEPSCESCGKETVNSLGLWEKYSPALAWPFATWLIGFGAYRLIIAFQPAFSPRLMRGLVFLVLLVAAKGIWSTYCRHSFDARIRHVSERTPSESDVGAIASESAPTHLRPTASDEIALHNVEASVER